MSKCWLWLVALPGISLVRGEINNELILQPAWRKILLDELGEVRTLVSASHWSGKTILSRYRKQGEIVFADSGGAQFIEMPKSRMSEFYKAREEMYRAELFLGDYVAAGDIPGSKAEMSEEQLIRSLRMTIENTDLQFQIGGSTLSERFINALHGVSPSHLKSWWYGVREYPSVGWAIGVKPVATVGTLMQLLFLYEQGEFDKPGKILHIFGTGASSMLYGLWYVAEKLGLDVQWSVDCSSHSLHRFGRIVGEMNAGILFSEIRSGKKKVTLYDGTELTTIPTRMGKEMSQKIYCTSTLNYCRYWNWFVGEYAKQTPRVMKIMEQDKVFEVFRWWKMGGTDLVWSRLSGLIPGREQVSLR